MTTDRPSPRKSEERQRADDRGADVRNAQVFHELAAAWPVDPLPSDQLVFHRGVKIRISVVVALERVVAVVDARDAVKNDIVLQIDVVVSDDLTHVVTGLFPGDHQAATVNGGQHAGAVGDDVGVIAAELDWRKEEPEGGRDAQPESVASHRLDQATDLPKRSDLGDWAQTRPIPEVAARAGPYSAADTESVIGEPPRGAEVVVRGQTGLVVLRRRSRCSCRPSPCRSCSGRCSRR